MAPVGSARVLSPDVLRRVLCGLAAVIGGLSCSLPAPQHGPLRAERPTERPTSFVVIGDTQRSLWVEENVLGREQNEGERTKLIDQLANEENPAFIVHLGDLVAKTSPPHWRYFDELMQPLVEAEIPILPVLGNHEYFGEGRHPERSARLRFPDLARGGYYAKRWGRLGLVWLDTNLTGRAAARQAAWLEATLALLDGAPSIAGTLVFTHHPPFTNGVDRRGQDGARADILPLVRCSKKALALISAHVHGYERFELDGLSLIVSGGGGGPRVDYRTHGERSLTPATPSLDTPLPRPLHYLVLRDTGTDLLTTARCLDGSRGCPTTGILDETRMPVPRTPSVARPSCP